jgi:hypothetical protein
LELRNKVIECIIRKAKRAFLVGKCCLPERKGLLMAKIAKNGKGKTLYIELNVFQNAADPTKNLTISCPSPDTQFKTSLSENGLKKFKEQILSFYKTHILDRESTKGK